MYGSFNKTLKKYYNKITYTVDGTSYADIRIFMTDKNTQSIAPGVLSSTPKTSLSLINPNGISSTNVVAKTNGPDSDYDEYGALYNGTFYIDGLFYQNSQQIQIGNWQNANPWWRGRPTFCVKSDGSAAIRWYSSSSALNTAASYCDSIIACCNPLVYSGLSVFENVVTSSVENGSHRLANWSDLDDDTCHFNSGYAGSHKSNTNRTFLGHKPDGTFFLVCVVPATMNLRVGAKLMEDLGCDYAVNMDGSGQVQMRVASGYTNGATAGRMTAGTYDYYGHVIAAYNK
jgi:Predicted periplasmic protein (DUF2233).